MSDTQEKARILICEDEVLIAKDLESRLKRLGYTIVGNATSGKKALELVEQHKPDLVMMDIVLQGGMDGIDVAEVIRDKWSIPVVFLTAYADTHRLERAKLTYPFGYLLKPIQDRGLKITIEMALYVANVDADRRKAEEELKNKERILNYSQRSAKIGSFEWNLIDNSVIWSNEMYAIIGVDKNTYTPNADNFSDFIHPEDLHYLSQEYFEKLTKNKFVEIDYRIINQKTGETKQIHLWFENIFDENGKPVLIRGTFQDISNQEKEKYQNEFQAKLLNSIGQSVIATDVHGTINYWNKAAKQLYGWSKEEALGKEITEFAPTEQLHKESKEIMSKLLKGESWSGEFEVKRRNGTTFPVQVTDTPVLNEQGELIGIIGVSSDITDRKQKEKALRDSEQRHKIIFEHSPLGMIYFDSEGTIVNCNDTFVKLMGSTREKLIGFNTARRSTPDMQKTIKRALSGNNAVYEDQYTSITGGKTLDIRVVFNPVNSGHNPTAVIATLEDITERRRAEKSLKESEEQFRATFDEAGIGMAIVNPTGSLIKVNNAMVEMLGYSNDELTKMTFKDITHPNDIEKDISLGSELFAGKRNKYQLEKRYVRKNGKVVWGRLTGSLVRDTDGTPKFAVGMIENITDRKQAEETLKQYEWITEKGLAESVIVKTKEPPRYGDVTDFNTKRVISDSVGKNQLADMAADVMALLDTSLAVYESNGDYAYGVFESGWCQTMDYASFRLCNMDDTQKALSCGKWLCHENCWNDSAKAAIESGRPTDIECVGGIHLYGVPIFAGDEVIGAVNIGYGNPSKDKETLRSLANKFNIDLEVIESKAFDYKPRPEFIIEIGKRRCSYMAQMIGDIIERKQVEIEREKLIVELQDALSEIHKLRGFLPICSHCKNVRDDEGYWQQIEKYISDRTKTQFSHGICPDCMKKLYPDYCDE